MESARHRVQQVDQENFREFNAVRVLVGVQPKTWDQFVKGNWVSWLIQNKESNEFIGMINTVPFREDRREIGFVLIPSEREKGIVSEILGSFVSTLSTPLYAETGEDNIAAKRVLEKAGFQRCDSVNKTHVDPTGKEVLTAAFKFELKR